MLDGLDEQRRALASEDPERRKWARDQLRGHDEASAHAVPLLLELVADPATPERNLILLLLDGMTVGEDDFVLPEGVRAGFEELPTYRAVHEGVPLFRKLLWDGDTELEAQAAKLLAWFPGEADGSLEALWARLEKAPQTVAGACLAAIGLLGGRHQVERLAPLLIDDDPYRRWGAAIALARIAGREAPDPTLDVLLDAAIGDLPDGTDEGVEFDNGDMPGLRDPQPAAARPARPRRDARGAAWLRAARARRRAVRRSRSGSSADPSFAELTDDQQRVLREVLRSGWVVGWQLRNLGLPETRGGARRLHPRCEAAAEVLAPPLSALYGRADMKFIKSVRSAMKPMPIEERLKYLTPEQRAKYDENMRRVEEGRAQSNAAWEENRGREAELRVLGGPAGQYLYGAGMDDFGTPDEIERMFAEKGVLAATAELRAKRKGDFKNAVKQSFNVSAGPADRRSVDSPAPNARRATRPERRTSRRRRSR